MTGFRTRVVALAVLMATSVVTVLVILTHLLLSRVTDADANTLAHTRAEAMAANVSEVGGRVVLTESTNEALDTVSWVYVDGALLDGLVPRGLETRVQGLADAGRAQTINTDGFRLTAMPVASPHHRVTVVVGVDMAPYATEEKRGLLAAAILGALAVALSGLIAWVVVGRAMRVVHEMASLADDWGDHDLGRRFDLGAPRDEFGELGRTLDHLLDRVERAVVDERRLTDEIAHELRTPLTALRGEAQLAQLSGEALDPALVLTEVDRLNASVSTILGAARPGSGPSTSCDLRSALEGLGDARMEVPAGLRVAVSADVAVAVISPLIDNAAQHRRLITSVVARRAGQAVVVDVLDDGPGFSPDAVDAAFEPGHSGRHSHGLGLAVVRRIATSAGVEVRAIADGRGHVEVTFPAADS